MKNLESTPRLWLIVIATSILLSACFKDSPSKAVAQCEFDFSIDKTSNYSPNSYKALRAKGEFCRICMQRKGYSTNYVFQNEEGWISDAEVGIKAMAKMRNLEYSQELRDELLPDLMQARAKDVAEANCSSGRWE